MNNLSSTSIETAIDVFMNHHGAYFGELESLQVAEALRELLALREAGKEPVAWRYRTTDINGNPNPDWSFSETESLLGLYQPLYAAPQLPAVNAAEEKLKRLSVILSGSDAPGEMRSLTVTAQSYVDRCQQLAKDRELAPQMPAVPDERAAFNAWNNEDNLPIAGVPAKNAAWLAWQARAAIAAAPKPE